MGLTYVDAPPGPGGPDEDPLDAYLHAVIHVVERLAPSVANLRVSRRVRGGWRLDGGGSAVVVTPDGVMLTSAHVVARPDGRGRASFLARRAPGVSRLGAAPPGQPAAPRTGARAPAPP